MRTYEIRVKLTDEEAELVKWAAKYVAQTVSAFARSEVMKAAQSMKRVVKQFPSVMPKKKA